MADFHLLIARAVERLPEQSPERRRAIYERARSALIGELSALDLPFSETESARLLQALEYAITRVEARYGASMQAPQRPPIIVPDRTKPPNTDLQQQPTKEAREALTLPRSERRAGNQSERAIIAQSRSAGRSAEVPQDSRPSPKIRTRETSTRSKRLALGLMVLVMTGASAAAWLLRHTALDQPMVGSGEAPRAPGREIVSSEHGDTEPLSMARSSMVAQTSAGPPSSPEPQVPSGSGPSPPATLAEQAPDNTPTASLAEKPAAETQPSAPAAGLSEMLSPPPMTDPASPNAEAKPGLEEASPVAGVAAQRAVLFEENRADAESPRTISGSAAWLLETLHSGKDQSSEPVVRCAVEFPEAGLGLDLVIRRNVDPALPASHIIDLTFTTPNELGRTVRDVGMLQLKTEEAGRGTPLAGLPVPVKENVFLVGLSNVPRDIEGNTDLLLQRSWSDLPIHFSSGSRAIIRVEKGASGAEVLKDAFRQWSPEPAQSAASGPSPE